MWLWGGGCRGYFPAFDAVAGAAVLENFGVVDDAVNHGGGDSDVAEALCPLGKCQVGRDDDGAVFVAAGDELEEEVRGTGLDWDVSEFVDDEQVVAA